MFFVLLGLTLLWAWDVRRAQTELDDLYWILDNTHSAFAGMMIPYAKAQLHERTIRLTVFSVSLVVFSVVGLLVCKYASKKHVSTAALLLLFLLFLTPLPATARMDFSTTATHYYARIEMPVPANPSIGDLCRVAGYIKPMPNTLDSLWVCYHIGIGFPFLHEWLGAGYVTEVGIGKVAYIEWRIDNEFHEVLGSGITWYQPIFTKTEIITNLWTAHVWSNDGPPMLPEEIYLPLPLSGEYLVAMAGGESIDTKNTMSATFSNLTWRTGDNPSNYVDGLWDGSVFDCEVIEDAPYHVGIISPYYKFMVLGGDPDPPPNPPDDGDDDGGGGGFNMYPTPLDESQRSEQ